MHEVWDDDGNVALVLLLELALAHSLVLQGAVVFHAAGLVFKDSWVLVLGGSRAGKSTLSAAALRSGGEVLSDDTVLAAIAPNGRRVQTVPWRRDISLRHNAAGLLPTALQKHLEQFESQREIRRVLRRDRTPDSFVDQMLPERIWSVSVDRRRGACAAERMSQASSVAALLAAGPARFLAHRFQRERASFYRVCLSLAETCRAYRVRLGRRLLTHPEEEMQRLLELTRG